MKMDKNYSGLQKALVTIGSVERFANAIGVTQKIVLKWLKDEGREAPPETRPEDTGIRRAVQNAGSLAEMARTLGCHQQSVQGWIRQGYVPLRRAQEIEMLFGVPRAELVSAKVRNAMGLGGEL